MKADLARNDPDTIRSYFEMVLSSSSWPDGFPQRFALAYDAQSKLLAIDYQLPDFSIVPAEKSYRYVKARDAIDAVAETAAKRKALYASAIAQSTIRIVHEVFEADRRGQVESIVLNCVVDTVDRSTGQQQKPCIVSVRTTAETFGKIKLDAVDPAACLKGLSAAVSPSPADLAPVRPVLELKMVDPRFITETDVLSQLDERPNLMELTPSEFESLITNLFTKMGLETRLTQASRDGGVDCVAFDPRPIFGGKVVIQAKRYKNTVGVSAVRDLFGTMQNEGASKGILVTTSGYGAASFQFAQGKPLELLSGANLLYLLAEHAGINARIVVPEEWRDPIADSAEEPAAGG
jgi:restriction system protein